MKIKPRTAPRDVIDIMVGAPIGLIQASLAIGVPSLAVALILNPLAGALACLTLCGMSFLLMVTSLEVQEDGILFRRVLLKPKKLAESEIVSVEEASRREVVIHGWLWPPWPFAREMTACLSARQHFRIQWKGGYCYFPPRDVDHFRKVIDDMMRKKTTHQM